MGASQGAETCSRLTPEPGASSCCLENASWITINMSKHAQSHSYLFPFLDNALPTNTVGRVILWAEDNIFKLVHQHLENELRVCTCWFTKTHQFYSFWAENQLGNMRGGRNAGMLILQRPCQSATPVPQHKCILCYFSWKTLRVCNECVLSASRCGQSAQSLQTGKGEGGHAKEWSPGCACWGQSLFRYNPLVISMSPGLPTAPLDCF